MSQPSQQGGSTYLFVLSVLLVLKTFWFKYTSLFQIHGGNRTRWTQDTAPIRNNLIFFLHKRKMNISLHKKLRHRFICFILTNCSGNVFACNRKAKSTAERIVGCYRFDNTSPCPTYKYILRAFPGLLTTYLLTRYYTYTRSRGVWGSSNQIMSH